MCKFDFSLKVGMVQRGEVDMGGGMFSLMKERAVPSLHPLSIIIVRLESA